jgi:hypothetical protein
MSLSYVVHAAIPDDWVLHAQEIAEKMCASTGGTFDWEFYDSTRVKYWFSKHQTWVAFVSFCALQGWKPDYPYY